MTIYLKRGTKVRTLYEHSETGTVLRHEWVESYRNGRKPMLWYAIRLDDEPVKPYYPRSIMIEENMLAVRNDG